MYRLPMGCIHAFSIFRLHLRDTFLEKEGGNRRDLNLAPSASNDYLSSTRLNVTRRDLSISKSL